MNVVRLLNYLFCLSLFFSCGKTNLNAPNGGNNSQSASGPGGASGNSAPVLALGTCATGSISEDSAFSCTLSTTDSDAGDSHTYPTGASHDCSWLSVNASGVVSATPTNANVGTCTVALKANDGTADSNEVTFDITVNNLAPTLTIADAASINEDSAATLIRNDAAVQASDEGSGTVTYSFDHAGTTGTKCNDNKIALSIDSSTGAITYRPASNYNGTCNIKVSFDDGNSSTVSDEFAITVNAVNDAPVLALGTCATGSISEDSAFSCTLSTTDSDAGDSHTYPTGASHDCSWLSVNASGVVSATPTNANVGTCTVALKANDGTADSNEVTFDITVNNLAPTLTIADAASINEDSASTLIRNDAAVQASDEGSGTVTYSFDHAGTTGTKCNDNKIALSIDSSTGAITYRPASNYNGTCNIKVSFDDGNSSTVSDEFAITVNAVNDAPVLALGTCATGSISEDSAFSCTLSTTDSDAGDSHTYPTGASHDCSWLSVNASGVVSATPTNANVGTCTVALKANDGTADSNEVTFDITVNNLAPTLTIADAASINEDSAATLIRNDAAVQASDEGSGTVTYSFDHAGTTGTKCNDNKIALSIDSSTGAITYRPASNYNGTCNIKVSFDDGNSSTVSDEFAITVNAVNDAPVLALGTCATGSISEDSAFSCTLSTTDSDAGDSHTYPTGASHDCSWLSVNASGVVSATPTNANVGTCTVALKANDGTADSNEVTFDITVNNLAPTLTIADAASINEDSAATLIRNDAAVQASDEGSGTVTYSFDHAGTTGTKCNDNKIALSIDSSTGAITYRPASNYNGTCNIKVSFDDGNSSTVSDEFAITVNAVNDAPVLALGTCATGSISEDSAFSCTLSTTDSDAGDSHTYPTGASHDCSWLSVNASGVVSATPTNANVGTCTVALKANDGTADSNEVTFDITVNNLAPTLTIADAASINEDSAATLIRNDAAVQASDEGSGTVTYSFDHAGTTGTKCNDNKIALSIDSSTGAITYRPASNYNGTCNIKVSFDDGNSSTVSDEFGITVNAVNDAPVFTSSTTFNINENTTAVTTVTASDIENDSLTFTNVGGADTGKLSITSAGVLSFDAAPDYETPGDADGNNTYIVDIQVSDGTNNVNQTITITVDDVADSNGLNYSTIAVSAPSVIVGGQSLTVTLTAKDSNGPIGSGGETVTFSLSGGTATGNFNAVTDNLDGTYTATFSGASSGTDVTIQANLTGTSVTTDLPVISVFDNTIASDVSSLEFWLEPANQTGPPADGTQLDSVIDSSSNTYHGTAVTTTRPIYRSSLLNSLPGIEFSSDYFVSNSVATAGLNSAADITIMFVAWASADQKHNILKINSGSDILDIGFDFGHRFYVKGSTNESSVFIPEGDFTPAVYTIKTDGVDLWIYRNGRILTNYASFGAPNFSSATGFSIGQENASIVANHLKGKVSELLVYSVGLTDKDRQTLEASLADKYNIAIEANSTNISLQNSIITVNRSTTVPNATIKATLVIKDENGVSRDIGGDTVAFSLTGAGTSTATFGSVTDNSDGTYSVVITGTGVGTPKSVSATINGQAITSDLPTIEIITDSISTDAVSYLRITELNYHSYNDAGGFHKPYDYIELINTHNRSLELTSGGNGVRMLSGSPAGFDSSTAQANFTKLEPGQIVLIVYDTASFLSRYPEVDPNIIIGEWDAADGLSNGGETVTFWNHDGTQIFTFNYLDTWFPNTDGPGKTMRVKDHTQPVGDLTTSAGWCESMEFGGSPGYLGECAPTP